LLVAGEKGRGRGRKTCKECVADDMRKMEMRKEDAEDRVLWKNGILGNCPTRARAEKWTLKR
jgi:ribosome biogenesis SPOUT family RNA methylase Rps3